MAKSTEEMLYTPTYMYTLSKAKSDETTPMIIVIGAGMAGISAAGELLKQGFKVHLLEASNQVGGRARNHTTSTGFEAPLGPMYIHGVDQGYGAYHSTPNPMVALSGQHGVQHQAINDEDISALTILSEQFGGEEEQGKLLEKWQHYHTGLKKGSPVKLPITSLDEFVFKLAQETAFVAHNGIEFSDRRTKTWLDPNNSGFDGKDEFLVTSGGYQKLIQGMFEQLQKNKNFSFSPNSPVRKISREETGISVTVGEKTLKADGVVCCAPLGVLKANHIAIPELSPEKAKAITHLQIALQNKVILEFDTPFWAHNPKAPQEGPDRVQLMIDRPNYPKLLSFINLHKFSETNVPVLMTSFYANDAKFSDQTSEQEIIEKVLSVLREAYPDMPEPKGAKVTHWDKEPYALGSWSCTSNQTTPEQLEALRSPDLNGTLCFAGEYASPVGAIGTVHGAHLSGLQAANTLAKKIRAETEPTRKTKLK